MSNENSNVTLGVLKYTIEKLKGLLNSKADLTHNHAPKDIIETNDKQFISFDEKSKVSKLNINGDGSQVLSNNGTYIDILALTDEQKELISKISINGDGTKVLSDNGDYILMSSLSTAQKDLLSKINISGDGTKILSDNGNYINLSSTIIDDTTVNTSKTYSSSYINTELNKKASTKDLHTHTNKAILDKITDTGSKIEFLCADGTYKEVSGGINDSNITSTTTLSAAETVKRLDTKVDKINGKQLSSNDFTDDEKSKLSTIFVSVNETNTNLTSKLDKTNVINNLASTLPGFALDARMGKQLNDNLVATNTMLGSIAITKSSSATAIGAAGGNGWVGFTPIPLPNAEKFLITVSAINLTGGGGSAVPGSYLITKNKDCFTLASNNIDENYRLSSLVPNRLWDINYTATYIG
jgi:hypothetical protein